MNGVQSISFVLKSMSLMFDFSFQLFSFEWAVAAFSDGIRRRIGDVLDVCI